jgi:uncharacterized small protein (DUF1192 family)
MEISQINQRIAVLNADSKRINNDRAVSIGKKETLQKQMNDALAAYKAKYEVDLTEANLQAEIDRVSAEKLKEVEQIEAVLNLIKLGQYDEANALVSGTPVQAEEQVTPINAGVVQETAPVKEAVPTPPDLGTPSAPVKESVPTPPVQESIPTPPVQKSIPTPPDLGFSAKESIPTPPVLGTPVDDIPTPPTLGTPAESIPTPPDLGIPTPPSEPSLGVPPTAPMSTPSGQPIASFNQILGGSPFKPQGEV